MDITEELKRRVSDRKAELEANKDQELVELPEVALLVVEFLCVLLALIFGAIGKPEACCAMMLIAIYMKMRR
jgi:hypothetical protein